MLIFRFSLLLFFVLFFLNSEIMSTQTPYNAVYCWIIPPATVQKPWTSETVLEGRFRHPIWESRGAPAWGRRSAALGSSNAPINSGAIHQQSQREFFLNECRAIFNLGTQCCSFVLVTLFMRGWRRAEGRGALLLPDTSSPAPTVPSKGAAVPLPPAPPTV